VSIVSYVRHTPGGSSQHTCLLKPVVDIHVAPLQYTRVMQAFRHINELMEDDYIVCRQLLSGQTCWHELNMKKNGNVATVVQWSRVHHHWAQNYLQM